MIYNRPDLKHLIFVATDMTICTYSVNPYSDAICRNINHDSFFHFNDLESSPKLQPLNEISATTINIKSLR
ncbi:Hypothetical predicted protein [Octopus vulgaris]|uniref:Uncharacterized protein n=1 Tax=Octopus vulgaris TaxID=6645 RepID=A0AA36ANC2_OCTVU|nr:Hypothetical predicted protein [Octopus vulgaris]